MRATDEERTRHHPVSAALTAVLETLVGPTIATQVADVGRGAEPAYLVVNYADGATFDDLWRLDSQFLDWLNSGARTIVIVWDGAPDNQELVTPVDWVAATMLSSPKGGAAFHGRWEAVLLDLAGAAVHVRRRAGAFALSGPSSPLSTMRLVEAGEFGQLLPVLISGPASLPTGGQLSDVKDLAKQLTREALREENRRYRHDQGTFCAAVRILLGALEDGCLEIGVARQRLEDIKVRRGVMGGAARPYNFDLAQRYLQLSQKTSATKAAPSSARRFLLVDDEWESAGWDIVFPAIRPTWTFTAFAESARLVGAVSQQDLVFLDYDLGKKADTGLSLLRSIRSKDPFIPVVMFTGTDRSDLLVAALQLGATAVLVKELTDTTDRDSRQYFRWVDNLLKQLTESDPAAHEMLLEAWESLNGIFREDSHPIKVASERTSLMSDALTAFDRALFFLAYGWGLAGRARRNDEHAAALQAAGVAIGQVFDRLFKAHGLESAGTSAALGGRCVRLFAQEREFSDGLTLAEMYECFAWANECRHGGKRSVDPGTLRPWVRATSLLLSRSCSKFSITFGPRAAPGPDAATGRVNAPGVRAVLPHEERSKQGSLRFVLGWLIATRRLSADRAVALWNDFSGYSASGRELVDFCLGEAGVGTAAPADATTHRHVLLVDDDAEDTGWKQALDVALANTVVHTLRYEGSVDDPRVVNWAGNADLTLLDLCLPYDRNTSPDNSTGLSLLRRLREADRSVPVVMFSAHDDVLWSRRCLREGAQAFFVRGSNPLLGEVDPTSSDFFVGYYSELVHLTTITRAETDQAALARVADRVGRAYRWQAVDRHGELGRWLRDEIGGDAATPSEMLAAHISATIQTGLDLAWLDGDVHAEPLWRAVGRPWLKYAKRPAVDPSHEASVLLFGLVEFLVKLVVWFRQPHARSGLAVPIGTILEEFDKELRKVLTERDLRDIVDAQAIRNETVHRSAGGRRAIERMIPPVARVLRGLADAILISAVTTAPGKGYIETLRKAVNGPAQLEDLDKRLKRVQDDFRRTSEKLLGDCRRLQAEIQATENTRANRKKQLIQYQADIERDPQRIVRTGGRTRTGETPDQIQRELNAAEEAIPKLRAACDDAQRRLEEFERGEPAATKERARIARWQAVDDLLREVQILTKSGLKPSATDVAWNALTRDLASLLDRHGEGIPAVVIRNWAEQPA